jgi:lipoate-protein ligase A
MAYLICTDDLDGSMNMALDEVLWAESANGTSYMRLYTWANRPVLSLGYFQNAQQVRDDPRLRSLPYVRRLTGGGAIVHDHEITYSLALPESRAPCTGELYARVHARIASGLCELGIPAAVGGADDGHALNALLCFSRSDRFAVRVRGIKVLGSAQRRHLSCVLMHGALLLSRSQAAPDTLGLRDLMENVANSQQLKRTLVQGVEEALNISLTPIELPPALQEQAVKLAQLKYGTSEWNENRQRR